VLNGIHLLLTYACTNECDHCFLHCSPEARGTFTCEQLRRVFEEVERVGTVRTVYFEGGEPFLYYPLLMEGLHMAAVAGLRAGVVTNAYWATSVKDAEIWLEPIRDIGIADLSISEDGFHRRGEDDCRAKLAFAAATNLGIPCDTICWKSWMPCASMRLRSASCLSFCRRNDMASDSCSACCLTSIEALSVDGSWMSRSSTFSTSMPRLFSSRASWA